MSIGLGDQLRFERRQVDPGRSAHEIGTHLDQHVIKRHLGIEHQFVNGVTDGLAIDTQVQ